MDSSLNGHCPVIQQAVPKTLPEPYATGSGFLHRSLRSTYPPCKPQILFTSPVPLTIALGLILSREPFSFLLLPREMRILIYSFIFPVDGYVHLTRNPSSQSSKNTHIKYPRPGGCSLMSTCKLVNEETTELLYRKNWFVLQAEEEDIDAASCASRSRGRCLYILGSSLSEIGYADSNIIHRLSLPNISADVHSSNDKIGAIHRS